MLWVHEVLWDRGGEELVGVEERQKLGDDPTESEKGMVESGLLSPACEEKVRTYTK